MIYEAFVDGLRAMNVTRYGSHPRIFVSEIGRCPRSVMLRLVGVEPSDAFGDYVLDVMGLGVRYEDDTVRRVVAADRPWRIVTQYRLENEIWSGRVDLGIQVGGRWVLVEHKAKGDLGRVPQSEHLLQLLMYGELFKEKMGEDAKLVLYYRGWGEHREIEVDAARGVCVSNGVRTFFDPEEVREKRHELEELYVKKDVPDAPREPVEGTCCWKGESRCKYYGHCFGV